MTASHAAPFAFDPFATQDDPYPTYRRLRDEAPVHYSEERRVWSVTRFDDVMHVLKSPELFSSRAMFTMLMAGGSEKIRITWQTIPFLWKHDLEAAHEPARVRDRAQPDRRGRRAPRLDARDREPRLHAAPDRGLGAARARAREQSSRRCARGETFDLIADLAMPVPVTIIAEMLGVRPSGCPISSAGPTP